jgi:vitellogenic carboxypeptidase-like protein
MFYNGQLDIIIPVPMTEFFLLSVDWSGKDLYRTTDRLIWRVNPDDKEVAGYVRIVNDKFYQVIILIPIIIDVTLSSIRTEILLRSW